MRRRQRHGVWLVTIASDLFALTITLTHRVHRSSGRNTRPPTVVVCKEEFVSLLTL